MKPAPFGYHLPHTLAEAVDMLSGLTNAKILAGGQSLVPMMNFRYVIVDHLLDLSRVPELTGIGIAGETLRIGAMTRQRDIEFSSEIASRCPLMHEMVNHIGHRQTRNRGTIGGSIAHADPAAELPAMCAVHGATIEIASGRGSRRLAFDAFSTGFMSTVLEPDEIVTAVELPLWGAGHGFGFHEFARRRGDFAIVGSAALVELAADRTIRRAAIGLCGATAKPQRIREAEEMLIGKRPESEALRAAAEAAQDIRAISDVHGSADYRRHLVEVLTMRALTDAVGRCGMPLRES